MTVEELKEQLTHPYRHSFSAMLLARIASGFGRR